MKLVWVQQLLLAMMMVKKKNIKLLGLWKLTHLKIKYQMNPLEIALLKHKIADSVEVASPNGGYIIKIKK